MSYKHNDLRAMRERYWADDQSLKVAAEKAFLQQLLQQHDIYPQPSLDDARYLFFSLPSQIIVKGYALGFQHQQVSDLIIRYINTKKAQLQQRNPVKIQYKL